MAGTVGSSRNTPTAHQCQRTQLRPKAAHAQLSGRTSAVVPNTRRSARRVTFVLRVPVIPPLASDNQGYRSATARVRPAGAALTGYASTATKYQSDTFTMAQYCRCSGSQSGVDCESRVQPFTHGASYALTDCPAATVAPVCTTIRSSASSAL